MEQLEQCVGYFTEGGLFEWVAGGLFILVLVVVAFTKKNVPGFVLILRDGLRTLLKKK